MRRVRKDGNVAQQTACGDETSPENNIHLNIIGHLHLLLILEMRSVERDITGSALALHCCKAH